MLGLNDNWSNPTREAKADYRNLPYGTYTFQIRAIGESEVWSEPFKYTFTINPPWWQTWWAYTLYGLIFLAALRSFSLWREQKLRKEKEQLQQKVEERTGELKKKSEELEHSLEDLKSTQSQLILSEKMASLGELTAGIAHEIQNPLNFVNNFSEVSNELIDEMKDEFKKGDIEEGFAIADDIKQNLEKINHHGKRADAIVKGMLQHSRTSSTEKESTDLNALADEYLRLSYHGLRAKDKTFNSDLKTNFDASLPKANVIPQDIGRVLLNLINNAFYAVNEKAKMGIEGYQPVVTVSTAKVSDHIEIKVADNGNGIPEQVKEKIFQPFFTTKPTGQGTGLGLSLSYDIVKAHGGELKVNTMEGEGTTFVVILPSTKLEN
jgi:signal transduction histidine kinase